MYNEGYGNCSDLLFYFWGGGGSYEILSDLLLGKLSSEGQLQSLVFTIFFG